MHAATRDDEHRRAVEEELVAPALLELEGVDEAWAARPAVDHVQPVASDREDVRAVRLDDVGLVDA